MKRMLIAAVMSLAILGGSAFAAQPQERPQDRQRNEARHKDEGHPNVQGRSGRMGRTSHRRRRGRHTITRQHDHRNERGNRRG
jgi:hypothetical protein